MPEAWARASLAHVGYEAVFFFKRLPFFFALTTWHAAWLYAALQLATHASFFYANMRTLLVFSTVCLACLRANSTITEKYAIDMLWRICGRIPQSQKNMQLTCCDKFYQLFPRVDKTFCLFFPKEAYKWRTYWWAFARSFSVLHPTSILCLSISYEPLTF